MSTSVDERQPLLPSSKPPSIGATPEQVLDPSLAALPSKPRTTKWTWVVRFVIFAALVVGLAFLIKAFVDSKDVDFDLGKALKKALGGGLSGAAGTLTLSYRFVSFLTPILAMVLQVLLLMVDRHPYSFEDLTHYQPSPSVRR